MTKILRILVILSSLLWSQSTAFMNDDFYRPCSIFDTINITAGIRDKQGNIEFEENIYGPREYSVYDYVFDYTHSYVKVKPHIRGCLCTKRNCIRLCCPPGQIANENERRCMEHPDHEVFVNITDEEEEKVQVLLHSDNYGIVIDKPCKTMYFLDPEEYDEDKWYFLKNGSVLLQSGAVVDHHRYCFGNVMESNKTSVTSKLMLCFVKNIELRYQLYPVGMLISIPFLVVTFLVYGLISELRNLHGKSLMCYVANLIVLYVSLSIIQLNGEEKIPEGYCELVGYSTYVTVLFCFFWLNVMCIDIYSTFKGKFRGRGGSAELKRFLQYCAYAFGVPILLLIILIVMDHVPVADLFKPRMGVTKCFISHWLQQFIYMYLPISVILVVNMVLYSITAFKIYSVQKETSNMKNGDSQKHSTVDADKDRFFLYLRLFIVMGITWAMESISFMFEQTLIFYVTDVLNSLQGFVIFILFVWKPKVKKLIMRRYRSVRKLPPTSSMMASRASRTESSRVSSSIKHNSEKILLAEHC